MSAKIIVMQGNMVATIEEANKDAFLKRGEYKETDLDRHKRDIQSQGRAEGKPKHQEKRVFR